jgi:hypothetical protein
MAKNRKKLSKKLEIKAENLGTVLKDRGILLDGISGDFILKEVELIRQETEAFHLKKLELLESKEKLKTRRENLFKIYDSGKSYLAAYSIDDPELRGRLSSILIRYKPRKKKDI